MYFSSDARPILRGARVGPEGGYSPLPAVGASTAAYRRTILGTDSPRHAGRAPRFLGMAKLRLRKGGGEVEAMDIVALNQPSGVGR